MLAEHLQETLKLGSGVSGRLIHVNKFFHLCQAEPEPLATQGQPQAYPVSLRIHTLAPAGSVTPGCKNAVIFVKSNGPGRDIKFGGQFADRELCHTTFLGSGITLVN